MGRDWLARFDVVDPKTSGSHLVFTRRGGLAVADVGSRNGTWVNGAKLAPNEPVRLEDGAILRVGRTLFVYRSALVGPDAPDAPLGRLVSPYGLRAVRAELARIRARAPSNVLVLGPTGTGKELVAEALASLLGRDKRFARVNITAIPEGVFDSQLFGYVRGAFSGSGPGARGVFLDHDGGAVFLDEIGDLPLTLQPKLLRLLDNREVLQVGATKAQKVDVVVIAATNRSLAEAEEDRFRPDLYARLAASQVELPSLAERAEDLYALLASEADRLRTSLDPRLVEVDAVERLMLHNWPLNVRELTAKLVAVLGHAPAPSLKLWAVERVLGASTRAVGTLTREGVESALREAKGNQSAAARKLGVDRGALLRFLKKLDANS